MGSVDDGDHFLGQCVTYPPLPNGHVVRLLFSCTQLDGKIYPALKEALEEGGFERAGLEAWDLLTMVSVGGAMSFTGPRYPNPSSYKPDTMQDLFMKPEQNLVHELMSIVFSVDGHASYGRTSVSFKEVNARFEFNTDTAFRSATLVFRAENQAGEDLYRVKIEGAPDDLSTHKFSFQPSVTWLCSRYPKPEKSRMTARIGGALADSGGEGDGEGGSNGLSVPAVSEPLIKVLVRSQRFRNSFQIR